MISQKRLKERIRYCPESGQFWWLNRDGITVASRRCGCVQNLGSATYRTIRVDGHLYYAHRLAWLYVHGCAPRAGFEIDHIDGDGCNNAMSNLRVVSSMTNKQNMSRRQDNSSGVTGVSWHRAGRKWMSSVMFCGKSIYLGLFADINDAIAVRKMAEQLLGFHRNHGRAKISF